MGILVDNGLKEKDVGIKRLNDRLIAIKLMLEEDIIHIISVYAPLVRSDESFKRQVWEKMDGLVWEIEIAEKIFLGGDLDGHVA